MANRRTLALFREARLIDEHYPQGQTKLKPGTLCWTGELQPSEISRQYLVGLRYAPPHHPRVYVRHPKLVNDPDGNLPHIYPDGSLCLHEPRQWAPGDPIAETIVPWTCEWLLHYEFWLAIGEWCGSGGNHTGPIAGSTTHHRHRSRRRSKDHTSGRNQRVLAGSGVNMGAG